MNPTTIRGAVVLTKTAYNKYVLQGFRVLGFCVVAGQGCAPCVTRGTCAPWPELFGGFWGISDLQSDAQQDGVAQIMISF